jgi:hypothetical protein
MSTMTENVITFWKCLIYKTDDGGSEKPPVCKKFNFVSGRNTTFTLQWLHIG